MMPIETRAEGVCRPQGLLLDERHDYLGYGIHRSHCGIRVYVVADGMVVVISEPPDNHGTSVTNAIEQIASELLPNLVGEPDRRDTITWIEHYPAEKSLVKAVHRGTAFACSRLEDTFDQVTFKEFDEPPTTEDSWLRRMLSFDKCAYGRFRCPSWRRISREELEKLIGRRWE
jgi:hypothetical protein